MSESQTTPGGDAGKAEPWMNPVADDFIQRSKARSPAVDLTNRDQIDAFLTECRAVDIKPDGKPKGAKERVGYFWINDHMKTKGRNAFIRLVQERAGVPVTEPTPAPKKDKAPAAPPAPPAPPSPGQ